MNRQDDPALAGDRIVYRRIPPWPDCVTWDTNDHPAISSANFRDDELSVNLADETTPERVLANHDGFGLAQLTLQHFRDAFAQFNRVVIICRDDKEPQDGHVLVCGKASRGITRRLKELAMWVPDRLPRKES